ncbi:MAG: hypothetical protein HY922_02515 [Elusimicrobia bacterium]|nr:hypothetical protein [Elusimicrobiota bacterium]
MEHLRSFSREELLALVEVYAKNWLAHDGCWFLAAEEKLGMEAAIELDTRSWERFSPAEAKRIMAAFAIPAGGGLDALEKALWLRLYACVNPQAVVRPEPGKLVLRVLDCRVQSARRKKGLKDFPCKSVGIVEYTQFARAVDPRIKTRCLNCPPDPSGGDCCCAWEFSGG